MAVMKRSAPPIFHRYQARLSNGISPSAREVMNDTISAPGMRPSSRKMFAHGGYQLKNTFRYLSPSVAPVIGHIFGNRARDSASTAISTVYTARSLLLHRAVGARQASFTFGRKLSRSGQR